MKRQQKPPFQWAFLAPKYWGLWLGIGLWRTLLLLPYPALCVVAKGLSELFRHLSVGKKRIRIARRNLELCFPEKNGEEIDSILEKNIESVGMAIIETGMAWFWSDKRIKKLCRIEGIEHIQLAQQENKGVLLVGVHFLTLEMGARIIGLHTPGVGVYRPNNNPLFDWFQVRGRLRSNKALLDRKDLRGMMKALRQGEIIWYAPDHDYGRKAALFAPFFAVNEAATTTGTDFLLRAAPNAKVIPFSPLRTKEGYIVTISAPVTFDECQETLSVVSKMNKVVEGEILKGIEQYMWFHRRFKTRPKDTDPSLYD